MQRKRKTTLHHVTDVVVQFHILKRFYFCIDYRYGYPDFTYLSRVRSELAAKGIGSTSTSSAAVTNTLAKLATTCPAFHTPVTTKTSTHMSSKSSASSREPAASAPGHTALYHSKKYDTSGHDSDKHSTLHVEAPTSSSVASTIHNTSQHGIDRSSAVSSSSYAPFTSYTLGTSNPRTSHNMSAVSKTYYGVIAGSAGHATHSSRRDDYDRQPVSRVRHSSADPHSMSAASKTYSGGAAGSVNSTDPYSSGHSTGGHATRSSRRDDYHRQQVSRDRHSSADAARVHSAISCTGVYDTNRRYH